MTANGDGDPKSSWRIGGVEIGHAVVDGSVHRALNERNSAEVVVDVSSAVLDRIDFSSQIIIESKFNDEWHLVFSGGVRRVVHGGPTSTIYCEGAQGLVTTPSGVVVHRSCNLDLVESLIRTSGIPHQIAGLPERPAEVFEVLAPVTQVHSTGPVHVGHVSMVSRESAIAALDAGPQLPDGFRGQFLRYPGYARTFVRSASMHDAQQNGIRRIDDAISKLVVGSRYSLFRYPSRETYSWRREHTLFNPSRIDLVIVRGTYTSRYWIRQTGTLLMQAAMNVEVEPLQHFTGLHATSDNLQLRQAFSLCRQAARRGPPVDRITALWQGLEFLLGGQKPDRAVFDEAAMGMIKRAARREILPHLNEEQTKRFNGLIGHLNDPPLMTKLRQFLERYCVPMEDAEMELLWRLRSYRNQVNHGKEPAAPLDEEIDFGVALMARILIFAFEAAP